VNHHEQRGWLREAISDETGQADISYVAIASLTGAAIGSLTFISVMAAVAYFRCIPLIKPDVVVNCSFDPLPMGQAAGLIFTAFAALIGALSGYMVATRKPRQPTPPAPPEQP
jgi:ribose/xylose/arabinose/galactoside ABC-type transport system permease subunit